MKAFEEWWDSKARTNYFDWDDEDAAWVKILSEQAYKAGMLHTADNKESKPSLRDQFAMAALQGLLRSCGHDSLSDHDLTMFCNTAYKIADAMLKVRDE